MKFSIISTLVVALAAESAASSWFSKAAYNSWHKNDLERWLDDHSVPYPTPADRRDLEKLVESNWNAYVVAPYQSWSTDDLRSYLQSKGQAIKKGSEENKDSLVDQVKKSWSVTESQANDAYSSVKDFIFDTWTESQLKSFLDKNGIPAPQPRTRDTLLATARANYETAAKKVDEGISYPADWLYGSWSDSDLKAWADERGYSVPQPSSRDKLVASVRRNSYLASLSAQQAATSASASAAAAQQSLSDALLESWSESQIKEWLDKNGVKVPQGSTLNEIRALARKHSARLTGDNVSGSAASAYGAATSNANNEYAQATNAVWAAVDWARVKMGLLNTQEAISASLASATKAAASSASSAASAASSAAKSAKNEL